MVDQGPQKGTRNRRMRRMMRSTVRVGMTLLLLVGAGAVARGGSEAPRARQYTVQAGDSMWRVAGQFPTELGDRRRAVQLLKAINGLSTATLQPGQKLLLPFDAASLKAARHNPNNFRATAVLTSALGTTAQL